MAQTSAIPNYVRAVNTLEGLTDSNGLGANEMLYGIPIPPGKVIGDTYLSTSWKKSVVLLYKNDKVLEGYLVRYDLYADEMGFKTAAGIKVLKGNDIKSFVWMDSLRQEPYYFINGRDYKLDGIPLTGFFEVLVDGGTPLFKKTRLNIKKASYNVALDVGTRDDKIIKTFDYYAGVSDDVIEIPTSRKKAMTLFPGKEDEMGLYMEANSLSLKKEQDLIHLFRHYNLLVKQ
jgi:hypothetical protein